MAFLALGEGVHAQSSDAGRVRSSEPAPFTDAQLPRVTPIVRAARDVGPAVVNIYQEVIEEVELPWPYRFFDPGGRSRSTSLGSGVIIDPDGFILTNAHVIQRPDRDIQVRLPNGSNYAARLVNTDPGNDVALLKIAADVPLPSARIGTSSDLMVGETIVAIGNPLGNENSVTSGIVSSLFRDVRVPGRMGNGKRFRDFIQLDAAINPGNSGGPLLNLRGEVIGINWAIASEAEGIGFAIPIDRVRDSLIDRLLNPLVVNDVVTGLEIQGDRTGRDVALTAVALGSPGARAGLQAGDRLVSVAGDPIEWEFDFNKALYGANPGDELDLVVQRGERMVPVTLELAGEESPMRFIESVTGLRVVDHPRYFGVVVEGVDPRGPAARLPILRGDLIDSFAGRPVDDTQAFYRTLKGLSGRGAVDIQLFRNGQPLRGNLRLR
jgi:serine protease Do